MSIEAITQNSSIPLTSKPIEDVLNDLDNFRSILDEWSAIETHLRIQDGVNVDLSSVFALITDHYHQLAEKAHVVLRQESQA